MLIRTYRSHKKLIKKYHSLKSELQQLAAELEHTPRKGTKIGDATFIYHYSDFRHDAKKVLLKYFDAMLYFSNWGTRRLMFRLPAELVDAEAIAKYAYESQSTNDHL